MDAGHCGEEGVNSPRMSGPVQGNPGPNLGHNVVIRSGDGMDVNTLEVDVVNKGVICYEPQSGLEFESKEEAYSFYRDYARSVGFGITIKASRRSKRSGKFIDVKIACSRFGSKRDSSCTTAPNSRSCPKTDCKASMHMKRREDGKWFIYSFVKEHNHEICPDDFYHAIRGWNKQPAVVACQKKGLQLALDEEDVKVLLSHFILMQDENPGFLYAIDLDHEKRMRNVFWVDAKGRHDYSNFYDVVFFDTSYVRNKHQIPFAPIIGVNHHFQFTLLGCALIGDETLSTYVWVMRTWLGAMSGQCPRVIITDEDKSLKAATKEVFPDARHCFCLWHVLSKITENLGHIIDRCENFMMKFNKCIYRSWTDEQFVKRWWKIVDKFDLGENEWIQSLHEDRKKWVPTYMRDTFLAGICTTERSESISSLFDKYICKVTTFKEFIDQYKIFLHDRYEEEAKADVEMRQRQPALRSLSPFEKQMSTVYTHAIFKKFQVEVLGIVSCNLQKESEDQTTATFRVDDFEEQQNFIVSWNEAELNICCLCHSFEYRGFLCRHAMIVLQMSGVSSIPTHYILKRWTKDAVKIPQTMSEIPNRLQYRVQRFNDLCKRAIKLGEKGSLSPETYDIAFHALEEALKHCVGVKHSVGSVLEPNMLTTQGSFTIEEENPGNNLAKASKRKKVHKKRKVQLESEAISLGMQESNQPMEQLNPRTDALENCYVGQQSMQGMELGRSRGPTLDGVYYGAQQQQQSVQGVGQLNPISSMRDGYYNNQQSGTIVYNSNTCWSL
ncbi:protein FAR1-RELATED SEQUENCE 2-like isoform X2 [Cornus florida]|nr:protein FAR1-RELATED SEQUENCE 2-like isoform X2 [Cornus florida]